MAPHITLIELGLGHTIEFVDIRSQPHVVKASGETYTAVNPKGSVPALKLDSGELLTENAVILQYLADQKPEAGLLPKVGTLERYHAMEWLNFLSSDVHKAFSPFWNPNLPANAKPIMKQNLDRRLNYLEQHLAKQPYLTGDTFSAADTYLWVLLGWMPVLKMDTAPYPNLMAYRARIAERPSVRAMLKAEGLA